MILSREYISSHVEIQKFGRLPDIDAIDTNEDIWDGTGAYSWLASETVLTISSSSANDTAAGTGAQSIRDYYQNAAGVESVTDIATNGQSAATTTITAKRVYRAFCLDVGSNGVNAGNIWVGSGTITNGVPANKYLGISASMGQSLMAIYTIPSQLSTGQKIASAVLWRWYTTTSASVSGARGTVILQTREPNQSWRTRSVAGAAEGENFERNLFLELPILTDIRLRVVDNGVNSSAFEGGFNIGLLK